MMPCSSQEKKRATFHFLNEKSSASCILLVSTSSGTLSKGRKLFTTCPWKELLTYSLTCDYSY